MEGSKEVGRGCVWWDDCTGMNESLIRVVMWLQPVCGRDSRACISLIVEHPAESNAITGRNSHMEVTWKDPSCCEATALTTELLNRVYEGGL